MKMLKELDFADFKNPLIVYALECRKVLIGGEYWKLGSLRSRAPTSFATKFNAILDFVKDPFFSKGILTMAKSYRVDLPVSLIAQRFHIDMEACRELMTSVNAVVTHDENGDEVMLCKESTSTITMLKPVGITAMGG